MKSYFIILKNEFTSRDRNSDIAEASWANATLRVPLNQPLPPSPIPALVRRPYNIPKLGQGSKAFTINIG